MTALRSNPKGTLQEVYMRAQKSSGAVMFQWAHWLDSGLFGARVTCPPLDSGYLVLPSLLGEGRGRSKKVRGGGRAGKGAMGDWAVDGRAGGHVSGQVDRRWAGHGCAVRKAGGGVRDVRAGGWTMCGRWACDRAGAGLGTGASQGWFGGGGGCSRKLQERAFEQHAYC